MDSKNLNTTKQGPEPRVSNQPAPPGITGFQKLTLQKSTIGPMPTTKGVENAKKRLRAFSIQKKTPITQVAVPKPISTGNTTVLIGKLSSVKVNPKPEKVDDDVKKPPKPPKPGNSKKSLQDSYTELQKNTISEIEDMKRKMELVELGIPLGLISPSTTEKAMPTKAMPPIKTFLATKFRVLPAKKPTRAKKKSNKRKRAAQYSAKVDEIIREAKKAKAEGREFKFDYHKFVPDYDNPFQRKKEEIVDKKEPEKNIEEPERRRSKSVHRSTVKYVRRHDYRKDDRDKHKDKYRDKSRDGDDKSKDRDDKSKEKEDKSRDKDDKSKDKETKGKTKEEKKEQIKKLVEKMAEKQPEKENKETDVNLNDYLVCDSWSLDNEDKNNSSSPLVEDKTKNKSVQNDTKVYKDPVEQLRDSFTRSKDWKPVESPQIKEIKIEKLHPVMDSFKFEIDPNDDEVLDIFDEDLGLEKYATATTKKDNLFDSPPHLKFDYDQDASKDISVDNDDTFLESVINEIKQEDMSDEDSQDKGLVEYDMSPTKDEENVDEMQGSVTPELDDKIRDLQSHRSDYSDGCRSSESGRKSTESGYKSGTTSASGSYNKDRGEFRLSVEKELDEALEDKMARSTVDSLETWSFVLKICQPLLFRHDKNKCYKETRTHPKLWYTENPKLCSCVKDRAVVYEELEMCKMNLVDRLYGCDQIPEAHSTTARSWYLRHQLCLAETRTPVQLSVDWETEEAPPAKNQRRSMTPERNEEIFLDREYQRFMQAVWPEVDTKPKTDTSRSTTPVRQESRKKKKNQEEKEEETKRVKKIKLSSEGWSQESDLEEEVDKSKKQKLAKEKTRKRKHSISVSSSESEEDSKKKKSLKKKAIKNAKSKSAKRRRLGKKMLRKLKEQAKKKKKSKVVKVEEDSDVEDDEKDYKKKEKKVKKKKQLKLKKKAEKKKKVRVKSSSSSDSSSSDSSSDSESEDERKSRKAKKKEEEARKKKKSKKKKRKQSSSESAHSEDLFDVNILNNIKTERLTDDEKNKKLEQSPPKLQKHREIINVKELQDDFSSNVQVKQEIEDDAKKEAVPEMIDRFELNDATNDGAEVEQLSEVVEDKVEEEKVEFKEPLDIPPPPTRPAEESNLSQSSSQESVCSINEKTYEKDESHLRPSSQNSNYSFNDVITASQSGLYQKGIEEEEEKFDNYEQGNYEMYEQLAMAYQSDVASQQISPPSSTGEQRIETVVRARSRGEIKCDWRASDPPACATSHRPSRWGLKPGDVNIVLTGGGEQFPIRSVVERVYRIQSLANRNESSYDEAYMDMYGAADRLQYGDCFAAEAAGPPAAAPAPAAAAERHAASSLDDRIQQALRDTVFGEIEKDTSAETDRDGSKGILVSKVSEPRGAKRVSFADGYKPGQDSDVEEPPVKKRKKSRRVGSAWPCPATHCDHVPLWDALPPPPPPPGSPPPRAAPAPPLHLLRAAHQYEHPLLPPPPHGIHHKFDPNVSLPNFMPPEPPPGLISFP